MSQFINIGYGNIVATRRIVAIVSADSAPIKRLVAQARGVIITDNDQVILSALQPETMATRLETQKE